MKWDVHERRAGKNLGLYDSGLFLGTVWPTRPKRSRRPKSE